MYWREKRKKGERKRNARKKYSRKRGASEVGFASSGKRRIYRLGQMDGDRYVVSTLRVLSGRCTH